MPFHKLPPTLYSWCWTARLLQSCQDGFTQTDGGIFLPSSEPVDDSPAMVHFSQLQPEGGQFSWLWLFPDLEEATRLRLLLNFPANIDPADYGLLEAVLPSAAPGEPDPCFVQSLDVEWLRRVIPDDVHEVWVGFDFKTYVSDLNLRLAATVYLVEEFTAIAAR